ncbi:alpha/beta hydrolase family protein [Paraliomyxa miuraensis]|uniref:hypothetical protein n=1 Tax=Paraliomyxa miuraensis TaxID=376150 RepID=UPI00224D8F3E|nr:hypothetical protein [Paraliomyxa miuraensis]MCX4243483.1 hypothetical protein [Paraliomyxa miuraensis]
MLRRRPLPLMLAVVVATLAACTDDETGPGDLDILEQLEAVPGMRVVEGESPDPDARFFELYYRVPNDHHDPGAGDFELRLTLLHRDRAAPMVVYTTGYHNYLYDREVELSRLVGGNQLVLEKRFTGESRPEAGWSVLTAEQVAADGHRVVLALGSIYPAPWLRSGASLGGEDALYHHYYHPEDFAGVVSYVSPFVLGLADARFVEHFATVVPQPCQAQLQALQELMLGEQRAGLVAELEGRVEVDAVTRIGGYDRALQTLVLELPWSVWQVYDATRCDELPAADDPTLGPTVLLDVLDEVVGVELVTDPFFEAYEGYAYQAYTQLGRPALPLAHLDGLVDADYVDLETVIPPPGVPLPFDDGFMPAVHGWVAREAEDVVFVYGGLDPWAAGRIEAGGNDGVAMYFDPQGNHGTKLADLGAEDQAAIEGRLVEWVGVELEYLPPRERSAVRVRVPR